MKTEERKRKKQRKQNFKNKRIKEFILKEKIFLI